MALTESPNDVPKQEYSKVMEAKRVILIDRMVFVFSMDSAKKNKIPDSKILTMKLAKKPDISNLPY